MEGQSHILHRIPSFDSGMVSAYPISIIPQELEGSVGLTSRLYNVDFGRLPGQISKRPGVSETLSPAGEAILGLKEYKRTDSGEKYILQANNDKVQFWDGTSWDDIKTGQTPGTNYSFSVAQHLVDGVLLAVANYEDDSFLWDGSEVNTPVDMPKAKYLVEFRNRLIAAGIKDYPLRLDAADPGFPTVWDPMEDGYSAFQTFVGASDGQDITGLLALDDFLLIGKEKKLYGMFGTTTKDFAIFPVDFATGVGSHWSMESIRGDAYFVGNDGHIYKIRPGEQLTRLSDPIKDLIDKVELDQLHKARAIVYKGDQYIVSLPLPEDKRLTLMLDTTEGRWTVWSVEFGEVTDTMGDEVLFSKPDGKDVLKLDSTEYSDEGTPIEMEVISQGLHFGSIGIEKEIRTLFLRFRQTAEAITVLLEYRTSMTGSWCRPLRLPVEAGEGYTTFKIPIGATNCREFQFKIANVEDADLILLGADITYTVKEVE